MAAQATLTDVIERLRAEGQLTRNTGTNSIKSVRIELSAQTGALQEMLKIMQSQENRDRLGRAGQDSGSGSGGRNDADNGPGPDSSTSGINPIIAAFTALRSLGTLGRIAAGAIGSALGVVIGQLNTIRAFFPKTVDKIVKPITDFVDNFRARMTALSTSITTKLTQVGTTITTAIAFVESVFSSVAARINSLGKLGRGFTGTVSYIYETLKRIVKVFTDVGKIIGGAFKTAFNLADAASSIMTPLKKFLGAVRSVAGTVGKLFVPLGVVLTLFDTIKETIRGYTEGGILGALKGGITGFFNSLIFGPLDLVKNLVSWVLEKFGFESASKFLDSFSFTELFTKLVNGVFGFVETAWNWLSEKFGNLGETLSKKWEELKIGFTNIGSWLWSGISGVWDWIKRKFSGPLEFITTSWNTLTNGVSSIGSWIWSKIEGVWIWIRDMFDDLFGMFPTIDELRQQLLEQMPDWMRKLVGAPERAASAIIDEELNERRAESEAAGDRIARSLAGENVYTFSESGGREADAAIVAEMEKVVNAPNPRIAILQEKIAEKEAERAALEESASASGVTADTTYYDTEIAKYRAEISKEMASSISAAVLPVPPTSSGRTDLEMLRAATVSIGSIAENQQAILTMAERNALQTSASPTIIVNAPTVAPVNNNVTGPTSVSNQRVTSIGTGGSGSGLARFAN